MTAIIRQYTCFSVRSVRFYHSIPISEQVRRKLRFFAAKHYSIILLQTKLNTWHTSKEVIWSSVKFILKMVKCITIGYNLVWQLLAVLRLSTNTCNCWWQLPTTIDALCMFLLPLYVFWRWRAIYAFRFTLLPSCYIDAECHRLSGPLCFHSEIPLPLTAIFSHLFYDRRLNGAEI